MYKVVLKQNVYRKTYYYGVKQHSFSMMSSNMKSIIEDKKFITSSTIETFETNMPLAKISDSIFSTKFNRDFKIKDIKFSTDNSIVYIVDADEIIEDKITKDLLINVKFEEQKDITTRYRNAYESSQSEICELKDRIQQLQSRKWYQLWK